LERSKLNGVLYGVERLMAGRFRRRLMAVCRGRQATAIHAIAHTLDFWQAYQVAAELGIPYFLSVHDDLAYALKGRPELNEGMARLPEVWRNAAGRFVISQEMGDEYCRRYGERAFEIITDGLESVPEHPLPRPEKSLRVYFMGLFHWSYQENLKSLLAALAMLQKQQPDLTIKMTMRCGSLPRGLADGVFPVEVLPFAGEADVQKDMASADLLYLPLPFGEEYESFTRYSLSTKMITYLGSGLPILYHGPGEAAAGRLLAKHQAAIIVDHHDPERMAICMRDFCGRADEVVMQALLLGRHQFLMSDQRSRFWTRIASGAA
jgi:glycosyltransferase involved in cell wall biosynthesis